MEKLSNVHPGYILEKDFLEPMKITAYYIAKSIGVDQTRISELIKAKRSVSADTAIRLGAFFGMSPNFWINAQAHFDLEEEKATKNYSHIKPHSSVA